MNGKHKAMLSLAARALRKIGAASVKCSEIYADGLAGSEPATAQAVGEIPALLEMLEAPSRADEAEQAQFDKLLEELARRLSAATVSRGIQE